MEGKGYIRSLFLTVLLSALLLALFPENSSADDLLLDSDVLKHRVYVAVVPPAPEKKHQGNVYIFRLQGWKTLLLKEGVLIDEKDWMTAIDLLRAELNGSEIFRLMNSDFISVSDINEPEKNYLAMIARFGVATRGKRAIIYLLDSSTGDILYTAEAWESTMQKAIHRAISELEEKVLFTAWRCSIYDRTSNGMIIRRGELDGLREGQVFSGYSIDARGKKGKPANMEFLVMKYGKKSGRYKVSEVQQSFSRVVPLDGAPLLDKGDILELPSIKFNERKRDSRRRRLWDRIYSK